MSHIYSLPELQNCRTHQLQTTQICFFSLLWQFRPIRNGFKRMRVCNKMMRAKQGNKRLMGRCVASQQPWNPNETNREKSSWVQVVDSKIKKGGDVGFYCRSLCLMNLFWGSFLWKLTLYLKDLFLLETNPQAKITTNIEKSINFQLSLCPLALNPRLLQPHGDGNLS